MKRLPLALIMLVACQARERVGNFLAFAGVIEVRHENAYDPPWTTTYTVKGNKIRIEGDGADIEVIDGDAQVLRTLAPSTSTYTEDDLPSDPVLAKNLEWRETGSVVVAGNRCAQRETGNVNHVDICPSDRTKLANMSLLIRRREAMRGVEDGWTSYSESFPLSMTVVISGELDERWTVTRFENRSIPDARFVVPPGWKKK